MPFRVGRSLLTALRGESNRGGGVGGAPPPRSGCAWRVVPHFAPPCNTFVVICPTFLERWTDVRREIGVFPGVSGVGRGGATARVPADAVQPAPVNGALRVSGPPPTLCRPFRRRMWEGTGQGLRRDSIACSAPPRSRSSASRWRPSPRPAASRRHPRAVTPTRRRSSRRARPCTHSRSCSRGRAARRRARRRRQALPHRRSRRLDAAEDRRGARRGGRRPDVGEGLRAVARRGGRRLGHRPRAGQPTFGVSWPARTRTRPRRRSRSSRTRATRRSCSASTAA